jgi:predicted alpha/beta-fold hydrolase
MVRRGIETNYLKTVLFFKGDLSPDFEAIIQFLDKKFENPEYYAVGVSMGANLQCRTV